MILSAASAQNLIFGYYQFNTTTASNSAVIPNDLMALDSKADDGFANSGAILSGQITNTGGGRGGINSGPNGAICSTGSTYYTSRTTKECTPLIRMGGSAGNPL